ncbi:MAG: hypothetical protein HY898_27850 [Deltaproteobacteria bacterium]|nr:hypothetical protein [Deltaproteobacteria bacterium]
MTAVSWKGEGSFWHERVYYVSQDLHIHEGAIDPGQGFSWSAEYQPPPGQGGYFGHIRALVAEAGSISAEPIRYIAVGTGKWVLNFLARDGSGFHFEDASMYSVGLTAPIFGSVMVGIPWFFAVDPEGALHASVRQGDPLDLWRDVSVATDMKFQGDGAAVAWETMDGYHYISAIVLDQSGGLWEVRFHTPSQTPGIYKIDSDCLPSSAFALAAAARDYGYDAACVKKDGVYYTRYSASDDAWTHPAPTPNPPDINYTPVGPLAMAPKEAVGQFSNDPRVYTVAQEVQGVGYAFVTQHGEQRWHNLLDSEITSELITANTAEHWTETCAAEVEGNMLLASMRLTDKQMPDLPQATVLIRAKWSYDDGHTWKNETGFITDWASQGGGDRWLQGDPTAVLLNSNPNIGYVMFHEFRMTYNYGWCQSRIRLYRVTPGATQLVDDLPPEWLLPAVKDPDKDPYCTTSNKQYLDHPFMAADQNDKIHIAWLRTSYDYSNGMEKDPGVFYRVLDGISGKWDSDTLEVAGPAFPRGLGGTYVAVEPKQTATSYVAWDASPGSSNDAFISVFRCQAAGLQGSKCEPLASQPDEPAGSGFVFDRWASVDIVRAGKSVRPRVPFWEFATSPLGGDGSVIVVAYVARDSAKREGLRVNLSNDGGATWTGPETVPQQGSDNDRFAPILGVLGDGTVAVRFYEIAYDWNGGPDSKIWSMAAVRNPKTLKWDVRTAKDDSYFDLTLGLGKYPTGNYQPFYGDYRVVTGGVTHLHFMMSEPSQLCQGTCLLQAASSDTSFLPGL